MTQDLFMRSGATVDGDFRFKLWRNWDGRLPIAAWLMCNPSTADALTDDPTIRRLVGFSRAHGCGGLIVVNVWPHRTPYPEELWRQLARFGYDPELRKRNLDYIIDAGVDARYRFVAMGSEACVREPEEVKLAIEAFESPPGRAMVLGTSQEGFPRHPLYIANGTPGQPWSWPE